MKCSSRILQQLLPSVLFTTSMEGIHLTFDDGPHPTATPAILKILGERDVRATFFLLGKNVREYPQLTQQIKAGGHQIGNHSYSHTNLFFKKKQFIQDEILQTKEVIEATVGDHSRAFRPPYGYFNLTMLKILKEYGLTCVMWDINSKDFQGHIGTYVERRVIPHASSGSILLFHDNRHTTQILHTYLPHLLDNLLGKGFVFKPLPL